MGHTHKKTNFINVLRVPADANAPIRIKTLINNWQSIVGCLDGYFQAIPSSQLPILPCGCPMVMLVDEDGQLKRLPVNERVMHLYPEPLVGDVLLVGEGLVSDPCLNVVVGWISLPSSYHRWTDLREPAPVSVDTPPRD